MFWPEFFKRMLDAFTMIPDTEAHFRNQLNTKSRKQLTAKSHKLFLQKKKKKLHRRCSTGL